MVYCLLLLERPWEVPGSNPSCLTYFLRAFPQDWQYLSILGQGAIERFLVDNARGDQLNIDFLKFLWTSYADSSIQKPPMYARSKLIIEKEKQKKTRRSDCPIAFKGILIIGICYIGNKNYWYFTNTSGGRRSGLSKHRDSS